MDPPLSDVAFMSQNGCDSFGVLSQILSVGVTDGIVNLMGISAKSTGEVGRRDHFEAIFGPTVGHLSVMVGVNTLGVGDVLPSTS
jgi:hypothetical protein